jgi:5'-nucleotidase
LVISGINNGANMGDDTIYSGTVGAAMEAYLMGIPAIAFSQVKKGWQHLDVAAKRAREIVDALIAQGRLHTSAGAQVVPWLLNVNIPNLPHEEHQGFQICRLGRRHAAERVITQDNPRGDTMYWIGGALVAAFLLFGRPQSAEYRHERKQLRKKYQTYGQRVYSRATA